MPCFNRFLKDERGAVTIDWVVLTAGVVVLGLLAVVPIQNVLEETASGIGSTVAQAESFMD